MKAVLFVDMLGSRRVWKQGGLRSATAAFSAFQDMVVAAARRAEVGAVLGGGIETDGALLICRSAADALTIARTLYNRAFRTAEAGHARRVWLRGGLVPLGEGNTNAREGASLAEPLSALISYRYSDPALEAISLEKSGFKGMRLLVHEDLVDEDTRRAVRVAVGRRFLIPLRRLNHSEYPSIAAGRHVDYLWMAGSEGWSRSSNLMGTRLRYAAKDPEEFIQAAATQVVFHECGAILNTLMRHTGGRETSGRS